MLYTENDGKIQCNRIRKVLPMSPVYSVTYVPERTEVPNGPELGGE